MLPVQRLVAHPQIWHLLHICQSHPVVPAEACSPQTATAPLHRGTTVCATCAPTVTLHTDTHCPYATPTHRGKHTGWAAAATPVQCCHCYQVPRKGQDKPQNFHCPHQPCSYSKQHQGLSWGWGGRQWRVWHTQCQIPEKMGEEQSQKARIKPKSGNGDAGVRGGAAASQSMAQTNSKRG